MSRLLSVAATRQQVLLSLVETDPGEALRVALPANLRAGMASSVQRYLEKEVDLDGMLEVLHEDWPTGGRYHYFLHSANGRYSLHFANSQPTHLLTGARIRVTGVQVGTMLALDGNTSVQTVAPAPVPNTLGAQKTLVILVNFQDNPIQPYTLAYAQNVVFGTTSNFFLENSYQQAWLTGDVFGWYTIPLSSTVCDQLGIASYARQAATAAGVNLSGYMRYVYAFPKPNACGWGGVGTVGGNPSQAWINGNLDLQIAGHEMGHNFGLYHSHSLVCSGATIGSNCNVIEYGDGLDIMGWSPSGHFHAFHKERLGWLNFGASPPITTVLTAGTYPLDLYEPVGAKPKALKILKSTNPVTGYRTWYYAELRQAIGFDGILGSGSITMDAGNILNGVVIHLGDEDNGGNNNYLLDMTPETYDLYPRDPALVVGRSFSDPDAGVTITAAWMTATEAGVTVRLGTASCTRAIPSVALSPSQSQGVRAGTAVTYTVSVTNNDGAGCDASSFNLQGTVPSGWTAAFAASTLTLSPGTSTSTTLTVTSAASTVAGSYALQVTVTDSASVTHAAMSSATYVIASGLNLSVATDKSSYSSGQIVYLTARASSAGSPVANANVTFVTTNSNGTVVSQTAITDSTGSAVVKFRLKPKDPVGLYNVRADASKSPLSGSATTSFAVQ